MGSKVPKCLVTQILEIQPAGWSKWQKHHPSKFEKSVPYALLCQVAGMLIMKKTIRYISNYIMAYPYILLLPIYIIVQLLLSLSTQCQTETTR